MTSVRRVAVLGAGIMGSATALFLARRGMSVALFDMADAPMTGASRWNEGKIHLGYLYANDPSLHTAKKVLPGGLAFQDLLCELIESPLDGAVTTADDMYLVHRDSVVSLESVGEYFAAVTALVRSEPDAHRYLVDASHAEARPIPATELEAIADPDVVVGGFRVPERSVSTHWVADRIIAALCAEQRIEQRLATRVERVTRVDPSLDGPWYVFSDAGRSEKFDCVVNALWEGRLAVDQTLGLLPEAPWSHRFRMSVFLRTRRPVAVPSAVLSIGPFGDIKNYNGRDFYVSWYPTGLVSEGSDISPPPLPHLDASERDRLAHETLDRLGGVIPGVRDLKHEAQEVRVAGGWVYAVGKGSLADPSSALHRRDRVGVRRVGSYYSVDTGKYSIAPWLARRIADEIATD